VNQQERQRAARRRSTPQEASAPLLGWNTRDPFEAMDPKDAVVLDNWFPDFAGLTSRSGTQNFVTGLGVTPVQSLATYRAGNNTFFLAACDGKIFNISGGSSSLLGSGFQSDIWQTCNFNQKLFLANGVDPVQIYDGTTLSAAGFTGTAMNTLSGVGGFNNRMYFWTGNDPSFWYGPVQGIAGVLANFPLSMVTSYGGNLIAVEVLSYDGGTGIDDYTCFFMSSGEVLMYQGTDPSNPNNWALVGRYQIPAPVAQRGITRYGGDVYIITENDHQQLSKLFIALKLGETAPRTKISGAAKQAFLMGSFLPGWQALYYPRGTRMIYNIPNPDGTFSQHIFNTSTQAWCRFRSNNAYCFGIYNEALYFGAAKGTVLQADVGVNDNGAPILTQGQQAWQTFGTPLKKRVAALRPIVQSAGVAMFNLGLGFDYQASGLQFPGDTIGPLNALTYGANNWGAPRVWGSSVGITDPRWHIGGGEGAAVGISLASNAAVGTTWIRTDLLIEPGSAL
jgi:hypothetical protein